MEYRQIPGISRIPLSEQVYNVLMDSIVNGSLEAGTELREQHIAKQMGVSATPVREAFKRLASDGLIEIVPYRGAVVKTLDPQEIKEAYACREALEHLVVKEAMERISPADIQQLHQDAQRVALIDEIGRDLKEIVFRPVSLEHATESFCPMVLQAGKCLFVVTREDAFARSEINRV